MAVAYVSLLVAIRAALTLQPEGSIASFCGDGIGRQAVTHHKAGTGMLMQAVKWIDVEAAWACASPPGFMVGLDIFGLSASEPYSPWLSQPRQHVLHVARNPAEVVVSEYAYDLSDAEPWMSALTMVDPASDDCDFVNAPFCTALK